jgi:hypothetical protein
MIQRMFNTKIKKTVFVTAMCWMILCFAGASISYNTYSDNSLSGNLMVIGLIPPSFVLMFLVPSGRAKMVVFAAWGFVSFSIIGVFGGGWTAWLLGGILPATLLGGYLWIKGN